MIVEVIDKRTGRTVRAENAYSGQRLECPYCGVDVAGISLRDMVLLYQYFFTGLLLVKSQSYFLGEAERFLRCNTRFR